MKVDDDDSATSNMRALLIVGLGYNNMIADEELNFLSITHLLNNIAVDMILEFKEK